MSRRTEDPAPPRSAVNQMEIARRLGISQGTVHRALAGNRFAGVWARTVPGDVAVSCCDDEWVVVLQGVTTMPYDERAVAGAALAVLCGEERVADRWQTGIVRLLEERESSRL